MGEHRTIWSIIVVAAVVALLAACGSSKPAGPPMTVVSVGPTAQAITLSTGDKYWDTEIDLGSNSDNVGDYRAACVAEFERAYVEKQLVGRTLVSFKWVPVWQSAPAGSRPAEVKYTAPGKSQGIDGTDILQSDEIGAQELAACPQEKLPDAPISGSSSSSSSDTNVNVDVDRDHHESRFCRKHRWC